jgi:hypothetical protein
MAPDLYCHWALAFRGSRVSWTQTDYAPSGAFTCSGTSFTAFGESGTWDEGRGVLSFSGDEYRLQELDAGGKRVP